MCLVVNSTCRTLPPITRIEMSPRAGRNDTALGIHQENNEVTRMLAHGLAKVIKCLKTAAAGNHAKSVFWEPEFLEEFLKPAAASGGIIGMFVVTGALDVDTDTHQRFPPISPFRQRRPRL